MGTARALQPWNERNMRRKLLRTVRSLPRVPLSAVDPPSMPGCYLQFFANVALADSVGFLAASGQACVYVGVGARNLRARIRRHRSTVEGMPSLSTDDVHVAILPCASTASAAFAEAVLIQALSPVLNGLGWGSRPPGAGRSGQRVSPIDALLGGRSWAPAASTDDVANARLLVLRHLALDLGTSLRWPALTQTQC
jgi:hypothetical protein